MIATDGWCDILCHIARHRHNGIATSAIGYVNQIGSDFGIIHCHFIDIREQKGPTHDGQRLAVSIGHLPRLSGRELVDDTAHLDVQRLSRGCYRQHKGYYI